MKIISYRRALLLVAIDRIDRITSILPVAISLLCIVIAAVTSTPGILLGTLTIVRRRRSVFGDKKVTIAEISGNNADTFDTGMRKVEQVAVTPKTNAPTAFAESTVNGKIRLTLTAGGAFTNVKIIVFGN